MGKKVDLDKLRSIGSLQSNYKSSKRDIPHRDGKGRLDGGKQVEHWDGRLDAHIRAKAIKPRTRKGT